MEYGYKNRKGSGDKKRYWDFNSDGRHNIIVKEECRAVEAYRYLLKDIHPRQIFLSQPTEQNIEIRRVDKKSLSIIISTTKGNHTSLQ